MEEEEAARAARRERRRVVTEEKEAAQPPRLGKLRFEPLPLQVRSHGDFCFFVRQVRFFHMYHSDCLEQAAARAAAGALCAAAAAGGFISRFLALLLVSRCRDLCDCLRILCDCSCCTAPDHTYNL